MKRSLLLRRIVPGLILILPLAACGPTISASAGSASSSIGRGQVPLLIERLQHRNWRVRSEAASGLAQMGGSAKPAVAPLQAVLLNSEEKGHVRIEAARALVAIAPQTGETRSAFFQVLGTPNDEIRSDVALLLGRIQPGVKEAIPHLIPLLFDPDSQIRYSAVSAMAAIGPTAEAVQPLTKALSDPSVLVRMKAAFALSQMRRLAQGAVPVLIKALDDEDVFVRRNALFALKKIGTPKAREALEAYRKQEQLRTTE